LRRAFAFAFRALPGLYNGNYLQRIFQLAAIEKGEHRALRLCVVAAGPVVDSTQHDIMIK